MKHSVLLSFDIEEFDMPFEYKKEISFEEQMNISICGTNKILDILSRHQVKATFFCTATFALNAPSIIIKIANDGHEIASHGFYHSRFSKEDYANSKQQLEAISQQQIIGFRMPRMQAVDNDALEQSGYLYNSSINPTYIPGRYNNLSVSRTIFKIKQLIQVPASVTPYLRFPLFWLSFHNLPLRLYQWLCNRTIQHDGYLNIYFHPWEFEDISDKKFFNFPYYISKNTGHQMCQRIEKLIIKLKQQNSFLTIKEYLQKRF